jgi:plasmid stabilization system protein ParE
MSYRLSGLAEQDLDEIWFYIAEDASRQLRTDLSTPSWTGSNYWPNSLGWVAFDPSLAREYGRSPLRTTSSTIDTMGRS